MKILITGGTGFLGVNLVKRLEDSGHEPVALVRDSSPTKFLPKNVETIYGDITDRSSLNAALSDGDFDGVAHLAMVAGRSTTTSIKGDLNWKTAERVNVDGSQNVFDAAQQAGVDNVVFTSTIKAHPDVPNNDDANYIRSKEVAETRLLEGEYTFEHTVVYPTNLLGPNDYRARNYTPFQIVHSNPIIVPPMYLPQTVNYVHVDNVTSTIEHGLTTSESERYIVSGSNISNRQYHKRIAKVADTRCYVPHIPFSRTLIPWLMNRLHSVGLIPIGGDTLEWESKGGIQNRFQNRYPFESKSLFDAIKHSHEWYEDVELL